MAKVRKLFKFHKSTTDLSEWNKNDDKLLKAVERGEVEKVETLLNKKTLMPTKPGPKGLSVFHWAALSGQLAIIEIFLAHGVDINATDLLGHTALHLAAKYGWPQMVEKLLQLGVNKHARDSDHMTALHHACGSGHPACVRALLHQGGGANDKDKSGRTALFYCGQSGDVGMCKWLLDHGADPNVQDMLGRTALIFAAVKGHRDVCELLLKRGADPDCRDKDGLKAVEYAIRCDHDLKDLFDQAPARASWDVNAEPGASNDTDGTQSTLFNDIVRQFSGENSPVPKERKSKQVQSAALSSQASSHSGKTNKQSSETKGQTTEEAYKELEEEHEVLTEELRVLRIAHIKLKDKVEFLTDRSANKAPADYGKEDNEKIQAIENEMKKIQMLYSTEKDKNAELEHKVEKLQEKLRCESKTDSPGITDNWGDSDDELFGGPLDKRPNEKTNAEDEQQLILLKSQILTLQQENDHLKEKLQTDSSPTSIPPEESINEKKEVTELSQANGQTEDLSELQKEKMDLLHEINKLKDEASVLRQTPLTHSVSMFSEGESGIHMNGERSRSPSDEDDLSQNGEAKLQEECRVLRETCKKMQAAYAALVEAGDKLQVEYDQQAKDKANLEEQLNEVIQDKEDLLRENDFLAADNLHEDLERLINELETLQETNKALEKEKNILQKRLEDSGSLSNSGDEDLSQVFKERDELKQRCHELEKSTTQLRQDHEIVIEEIQSIQERYGDLQTERDQLQQEVEIVQDELDKTTQQFELVQHEFGQLEQDYAELLADKGKLEQDLFESESNRGRDSPNQSLLQQSLDIEVLQQQHSILTEEKELLEVKVLELQSSNEELKKEVDGLRTQSGTKSDEHIVQVQPVPSSSEKDKQIRSLQVKISRLQQQVTEMERRHRDTVNTYRTHLVSAVQGHMDPDVQKALHHIIEIRSNEEFC